SAGRGRQEGPPSLLRAPRPHPPQGGAGAGSFDALFRMGSHIPPIHSVRVRIRIGRVQFRVGRV
ncbi:hypothetical protein HK102_009955, partial [Quaeritorhiza haematococci]